MPIIIGRCRGVNRGRAVAAGAAAWQESSMNRLARALAILVCTSGLQAAAPEAPPLRKPIRPWVLDYGETACTASRIYGSEASPIALAFRPSPSGEIVRLVVSRQGKAPQAYHFKVATNLGGAAAKSTGLRFATRDKASDLIWINFRRSDLEGLPSAGEIALRGGKAIEERFALPGMAAVLAALDRCNANLRRYWNLEGTPVAQPATSLRPHRSYFSDADYPAQALRENRTGETSFILMVDEAGTLKDCMVEETSGIASLDAMACIVLLDRAKFKPALDASGKPVRSVLSGRIHWVMD
jgi:hypothetical protein